MKCDKSGEITSYLKGEGTPAERAALRLHFEGCAACGAELVKIDRVLRALGKLELVDPSPDFTWRVREAFLRAHPEFLEPPRREPGAWWDSLRGALGFVPAWAVSVAAHVLLAALAAILLFVPRAPEDLMEEAAIGAKPRKPAGDETPRFERGPGGIPSRPGGIAAVPFGGREEEEYAGKAGGPGAVAAGPYPGRDAGRRSLDLREWKARIPRERRLLAFFDSRGNPDLRRDLGLEGTEKAVRAGLDWLARAQQADGRWAGPRVHAEGVGEFTYATGLTGLALLAFLADGHAGRAGDPYASNVRRGLESLLAQQRASGLVGSEPGHYMYDHGIAGLALLEASLMTRDEGLSTAASAAVNFTVAAQNETGGWGYVSRSPSNDTSVGGWQILLLRLAKLNGNHGVIPSLIQAHDRLALLTDAEGKVGYRARLEYPNGYRALTAVGMLSHQMSTHTPDAELLARQAGILLEQCPVVGTAPGTFAENDLYFGHFGSLALYQYEDEAWRRWFGPLRDRLLRAQREDGSWPADFDRWHVYGGPVYSTAMSLLILQTPIRYPRLSE